MLPHRQRSGWPSVQHRAHPHQARVSTQILDLVPAREGRRPRWPGEKVSKMSRRPGLSGGTRARDAHNRDPPRAGLEEEGGRG